MIKMTITRTISRYMDSKGNEFEVLSLFNPNPDNNDTWIEYMNTQTKDKFTCRFEAFESRFTALVD